MKKRLTQEGVTKLKPKPGKQSVIGDTVEKRLSLVLNYGGRRPKVWRVLSYIDGKQKVTTIGGFSEMSVSEARKAAGLHLADPQAALDRAAAGTFKDVAAEFVRRHVEKNGLRSKSDIERHIRYASDRWAGRKFIELRRRDVTALLDHLEDKHGAGVADQVLATLRKLMNWYESRSDDYVSPIVRGMRKQAPKARDRILSDAEIRALWTGADGMFGDFTKLLLLTGQRRDKVATLKWADLDAEGVWTLDTADREKNNTGAITLPKEALEIIARQPRVSGCPYVFPGRGGGHMNGFNKRMAALREKLGGPDYTLHDLRRTARSLLSRAGVRPDISERVLGHAIPGVEGVYDRHSYAAEKADALARLAVLVDRIVTPPQGNVIPLAFSATAP